MTRICYYISFTFLKTFRIRAFKKLKVVFSATTGKRYCSFTTRFSFTLNKIISTDFHFVSKQVAGNETQKQMNES